MTGHAVLTVDGEEIDAPAGRIVFVRDPALIRPPGRPPTRRRCSWSEDRSGVPYTVSRWEVALP
jgi:hypothetical protein